MSTSSRPSTWPADGSSPGPVRRAVPADAGAVAAALATAFLDDPVFRWIYAGDQRMHAIRLFFEEAVDAFAPHDDVWTTDAEIVGAAIWIPFGRQEMTPERGQRFGARVAELPGLDLGRAASLSNLLDARHPREPHEYLRFLGVLPEARGRGAGAQLMAPVLQRADAAGRPAYLVSTSARSKALYERHGFVAADPVSVGDGPPLWPMWREPQR